jgi:meiotically up-regulated gene 157 (Mug157) protein
MMHYLNVSLYMVNVNDPRIDNIDGIAKDMNVWAYEVDGYGGRVIMDDANIPSLLSLPYLGYIDRRDATYQATRALLWSDNNPFWWRGSAGEGIGGPHVGMDFIWPMSLIIRALTSQSDDEIVQCLTILKV